MPDSELPSDQGRRSFSIALIALVAVELLWLSVALETGRNALPVPSVARSTRPALAQTVPIVLVILPEAHLIKRLDEPRETRPFGL